MSLENSAPKKTMLYDRHIALGGKIIDFAGWSLPVQYKGITKEHEAVRNRAGIFDVSHMGEIEIKGEDADKFVDYLVTNNAQALGEGKVQYAFLCYENGTVVDDLLVYKRNSKDILLVVNASNTDKDYEWILKVLDDCSSNGINFDVTVTDISAEVSEIALQGPLSESVLSKLTDKKLSEIGFFEFAEGVVVAGANCLVSRTGYTGEDGFEIYCSNNDVVNVWDALLNAGEEMGIEACGLGCRDTLRFEAGLPLYGNELSDEITPLEAGLGFFVKLDKGEYIGKEALAKEKSEGSKRKIIGIEVEKGIPRHGYAVFRKDNKIGEITTGYISPTLGRNIATALVSEKMLEIGDELEVEIRNKKFAAKVVSKKFYQKNYKK